MVYDSRSWKVTEREGADDQYSLVATCQEDTLRINVGTEDDCHRAISINGQDLGVSAYPSYTLIDTNGNVLNVNAHPGNLDALESLVQKVLGKD